MTVKPALVVHCWKLSTHIVGYASKVTTKSEKSEKVTSFSGPELELPAIAFALKYFRHLSYKPQHLKIFTDHAAIVNIFAAKSEDATKRISSFVSYISECNFDLYHANGIANTFADLLSRMPDYSNVSTSIPRYLTWLRTMMVPPNHRSVGLPE